MAIDIDSEFRSTSRLAIIQDDAALALFKLPENMFSLIITSPPYNVGKPYECSQSMDDYLDWYRPIIGRMVELLTTNGSICWQIGNHVRNGEVFPLDILFYPLFKDHGLTLRNRVVWHYGHGLHAAQRLSGRYETLLWFTKSDKYTFNLDDIRVPSKYPGKRFHKGPNKGKLSGNPNGKNPSDFWEVLYDDWEAAVWKLPNVKSAHPEKTAHPCQFPVELVERCVLAFTKADEWILDPFVGTGTTLIAAARRGRRCVGIEIDGSYCELAISRVIGTAEGSRPIREIGTSIYQPRPTDRVAKVPDEWL